MTYGRRPANRFASGSAVFSCRCCGRRTRDTGGDNTDIRLCAECYELSGYENQLSDYGELSDSDRSAIAGLLSGLAHYVGRDAAHDHFPELAAHLAAHQPKQEAQ